MQTKITRTSADRLVKSLFPIKYQDNRLSSYIDRVFSNLQKKLKNIDAARIPGEYGSQQYESLIKKYSIIPRHITKNPAKKLCELASDLLAGTPRWRSPQLQYNVGAAVNVAASALYSVALDENVYNINEELAGNCLVAESAVVNILARLARLSSKPYGVFTFGGTATNLYAIKMGSRKTAIDSGKKGLPKNMKVVITRDAHFSHAVAADWLGIGTNNVVIIEPNPDRASSLKDAEKKLRKIIEDKDLIAAIIINGGTTYSHTIDDIENFIKLRNTLVKEYSLEYTPHIHVDSVIGWAWLVFSDYDFDKNELEIESSSLDKIEKQYAKISKVKLADSWGVDFHKGAGGCPVDCSLIIANDFSSIARLTKKGDPITDMHQLAQEFSFYSPADYTLETSRAGGAALAALASLHTLGLVGYQRNLANLIEATTLTRNLLGNYKDVTISNEESLGYITMLRIYPPGLTDDLRRYKEKTDKGLETKRFIEEVNGYIKQFFNWDRENRMMKGEGVEYSFSSSYSSAPCGAKIAGIKLYPVSPHLNKRYVKEAVSIIITQKRKFDKEIWPSLKKK